MIAIAIVIVQFECEWIVADQRTSPFSLHAKFELKKERYLCTLLKLLLRLNSHFAVHQQNIMTRTWHKQPTSSLLVLD